MAVVAAGALWFERQAWRTGQTQLARAALVRLRERLPGLMLQDSQTVGLPGIAGQRPDWNALLFPDVPAPRTPEPPLMEALRAGDFETVWREGAGQLSASGLPLRLLAARGLALKSPPEDIALPCQQLHSLLWLEPSSLTPAVMEEVEKSLASRNLSVKDTPLEDWREEWSAVLTWRALHRANGTRLESVTAPQWMTTAGEAGSRRMLVMGGPAWTALEEGAVSRLVERAARREQSLPPGTTLEYVGSATGGEVLAESQDAPALRAVVRDTSAFSQAAWSRTAWLAGFAALAVGGTFRGSRQMLRAQRREAELSRQKSNFIASVSHELRTPLTSLRVLSENLHAGRVSDGEMRATYFPLMVDECRRLGALIENVLEFARAEEQRARFHFEETDLPAMIADTVELVLPRARKVGLEIVVGTPALPESPLVDAMSLHRALLNLLDNAVKFTPPGGTITVRLRPAGGKLWALSVTDTGPGIPRAEHGRVFERFYRVGSELTRAVPGSGMGLSIVRHIAEGHGGQATVESVPGAGATFTLLLPYEPPGTGQ